MEESITLNSEIPNGRYYANAPENKNHAELGDNYRLAYKRWLSGNVRMVKDKDLRKE